MKCTHNVNVFIWKLETCMMTRSAIKYSTVVITNWSMNTEFQWLKWWHINLPTRATRLMPLVEQELLTLPRFTPGVSDALFVVFCLMLCWSLFVFFFVFLSFYCTSVLIRFTSSDVSFDIFKRFPSHHGTTSIEIFWNIAMLLFVVLILACMYVYLINDNRLL